MLSFHVCCQRYSTTSRPPASSWFCLILRSSSCLDYLANWWSWKLYRPAAMKWMTQAYLVSLQYRRLSFLRFHRGWTQWGHLSSPQLPLLMAEKEPFQKKEHPDMLWRQPQFLTCHLAWCCWIENLNNQQFTSFCFCVIFLHLYSLPYLYQKFCWS